MRYMGAFQYMGAMAGEPSVPNIIPGLPGFQPPLNNPFPTQKLDAASKAQLMSVAAGMSDPQSEDLCDLCDATAYGKRHGWLRLGIGAAVGLGAGFLLSRALKR